MLKLFQAMVRAAKVSQLEVRLYKSGMLLSDVKCVDGNKFSFGVERRADAPPKYRSQAARIMERNGWLRTNAILDAYKGTDAEDFMWLGSAPVHLGISEAEAPYMFGRKYDDGAQADKVAAAIAKYAPRSEEVRHHDNGSYSFQMQL